MSSNKDLRTFQNSKSIEDAFSALVSGGRPGYKTVIEKKKLPPSCIQCNIKGKEDQKFCAECGGKMLVPLTNCSQCGKPIDGAEKFCTECGAKLSH